MATIYSIQTKLPSSELLYNEAIVTTLAAGLNWYVICHQVPI